MKIKTPNDFPLQLHIFTPGTEDGEITEKRWEVVFILHCHVRKLIYQALRKILLRIRKIESRPDGQY
jgi:hypothetical protein